MPKKTHTEQIDDYWFDKINSKKETSKIPLENTRIKLGDYILFKETKEFFIFRNETGNEVLTKVLDITTHKDDDSVERNTILVRVEKV